MKVIDNYVLLCICMCIIFSSCTVNGTMVETITQYGNTKGNIKQGGYVVESNGRIYYTNQNDNDSLYEIKTDGRETRKVTSGHCYELNAIEDYIYYIDGSPGRVCRIKTDGTNFDVIFNKTSNNLIATDKYLFFRLSLDDDYSKLYRTNLNGDESKIICDSIIEFAIYDNKIYYTDIGDNCSIHSMNLDGKETKKLNNESSSNINIIDGYIYYSNRDHGDKIYRIDINGDNNTMISENSCWNLNVHNGYIYYRNQSEKGNLYRMDINGNNNMLIAEGNISNINITDEFILYYRITENSGYFRANLNGDNEQRWPCFS